MRGKLVNAEGNKKVVRLFVPCKCCMLNQTGQFVLLTDTAVQGWTVRLGDSDLLLPRDQRLVEVINRKRKQCRNVGSSWFVQQLKKRAMLEVGQFIDRILPRRFWIPMTWSFIGELSFIGEYHSREKWHEVLLVSFPSLKDSKWHEVVSVSFQSLKDNKSWNMTVCVQLIFVVDNIPISGISTIWKFTHSGCSSPLNLRNWMFLQMFCTDF